MPDNYEFEIKQATPEKRKSSIKPCLGPLELLYMREEKKLEPISENFPNREIPLESKIKFEKSE